MRAVAIARLVLATFVLFVLLDQGGRAAAPDRDKATAAPDPASIRRQGPGYRYPRDGWIVLHVEGAPYERGFQHGRLLASEIAEYVRMLATKRSQADPEFAWNSARFAANALFLRKFDPEYLEEMKGIADGAAAGDARFEGRVLDFLDVVTLNAEIELDFLADALEITPTGLESKRFRASGASPAPPPPTDHCSAFAATGPATADGKIVFGHITMFSQYFVRHFNVWLDVSPEKGHRVLMQTYPGGIQSGMDYYMNDAGLIVAETTIAQTHFNGEGRPLATRIRKALQTSDSIDGVVAALKDGNNGLYTNEWLLADTKTNEIAMFELGTRKSRLWRSSRDEWFGGTKGFYWGCNNGKDLEVRLETVAGLEGRPENVVFHSSDRDRAWLRLFDKHNGRINADFGFEAFTTPPLSAFPSLDAKFTTTEMARDLKTWAIFGPPRGKTWDVSDAERARYAEAKPLIPNDWTILSAADPSPSSSTGTAPRKRTAVDLEAPPGSFDFDDEPRDVHPPAWHGTILPETDADIWLAAAFADYEPIVAAERALRATHPEPRELHDQRELWLFAPYSRYRTAVARLGRDIPLSETKPDLTSDEWYGIASGKGVLLLDALRDQIGDEPFVRLMDGFGRSHAGRGVTTQDFRQAVAAASNGRDLSGFLDGWLSSPGLPNARPGGYWSVTSFESDLEQTLIVYGTIRESDAQREAASRLQRAIERKWSNITVPILPDVQATPEAMAGRHLLLVGRPSTNAVAEKMARELPIRFGPGSFRLRGDTHAHPRSWVIAAGARADDPRRSVVIFAGLGAESTWRCVEALGHRGMEPAAALVAPAGRPIQRLGSIVDPVMAKRSTNR